MRALFISLACWVAFIGRSQARLGETLDECVERYGPVIEQQQAQFSQSDPEMAIFSKSGITILVEFKAGKAWHVTFRKTSLTPTEIDTLLKANAGGGTWSPALTVAKRTFRQSDDHQRLCVVSDPRPGTAMLEFMSRDFINQYHASVLSVIQAPTAVEEINRKTNPLPGF